MELKNDILMALFTVVIGAASGLIIWCFIKGMDLGIELLWNWLPGLIGFRYYTLLVCLAGGILIGLWKSRYGDAPEELNEVIAAVRKDHRYPYGNMPSAIVSSILPLIIGASVGPEAGLTGLLAGLMTWIGDRLRIFGNELEELAGIGISATLGTVFASPVFGFVEPMENEERSLPKTSRNILYFLAILSSFGIFVLLNRLTHSHPGLHTIGTASLADLNYLAMILLVAIGILLSYLHFACGRISRGLFSRIDNLGGVSEGVSSGDDGLGGVEELPSGPDGFGGVEELPSRADNLGSVSAGRIHGIDSFIVKGAIGGLALGAIGTLLPLAMFSGESQLYLLMENGAQMGFMLLILTGLAKIFLTNLCIDSGLKGGAFFPMIFSGAAIGYGFSMVLNVDPVVSMAMLTASFMAGVMRKPIAVVMLLMIVFPMNLIPFMLVAAVVPCLFGMPGFLSGE